MADETKAADAKSAKSDELPAGHVRVRVLPKGDEQIHTGEVCPLEAKPLTFKRGEIFAVPLSVGQALEERGYGEIQP